MSNAYFWQNIIPTIIAYSVAALIIVGLGWFFWFAFTSDSLAWHVVAWIVLIVFLAAFFFLAIIGKYFTD